MLVDSHCHLNLIDYDRLGCDMDSVIQKAQEAGVNQLLCVGTTLENYQTIRAITEQYESVFASVGVHPNEIVKQEPMAEQLCELAEHEKTIAIGETGLDYYRTEKNQKQQERFSQHIEAARRSQKPLIVHTRAAKEDTLAVLKAEKAQEAGGVIHCFTEDWEMAKAALDIGFYISFSGILTFKNAALIQEAAKKTPIDRILIETDSPYLAPTPHRGKINQPAYVKHVAEFLANLKAIPFETVATQTSENFRRLFFKENSN